MYSNEYAPAIAHTKHIITENSLPVASTCSSTGSESDSVNSVSVISPPVSTGISNRQLAASTASVTALRARRPLSAGQRPTARPASTGSRIGTSKYMGFILSSLRQPNMSSPVRMAVIMCCEDRPMPTLTTEKHISDALKQKPRRPWSIG